MAYCRFSSNGWRSDVYVYASVYGGWQIHVACRRLVHPSGELCPLWPNDPHTREDLRDYVHAERKWRNEATYIDINGPMDGESYVCESPKACADKLEEISTAGYHVPDWVIPALRAEAEELKTKHEEETKE